VSPAISLKALSESSIFTSIFCLDYALGKRSKEVVNFSEFDSSPGFELPVK